MLIHLCTVSIRGLAITIWTFPSGTLLQRSLAWGDPLSSATRSAAPAACCCSTGAVPCIKVFAIYGQSFFSSFWYPGGTILANPYRMEHREDWLQTWSAGFHARSDPFLSWVPNKAVDCLRKEIWGATSGYRPSYKKKIWFSSPFMNLNAKCIFLSDHTMVSERCLKSFILSRVITSSIWKKCKSLCMPVNFKCVSIISLKLYWTGNTSLSLNH